MVSLCHLDLKPTRKSYSRNSADVAFASSSASEVRSSCLPSPLSSFLLISNILKGDKHITYLTASNVALGPLLALGSFLAA